MPGWRSRWLQEVPLVVMLDTAWLRVMEETGQVKPDKSGRRRPAKKQVKKPVMIALGIWPEPDRKKVLDWEVGDGPREDKASWLRFSIAWKNEVYTLVKDPLSRGPGF